jgi:hypothetical protein
MAKHWTKELGIQCFVTLATCDLPESGYHANIEEHAP